MPHSVNLSMEREFSMFNAESYELNCNSYLNFQYTSYAAASAGKSSVVKTALSAIKSYVYCKYYNASINKIEKELWSITGMDFSVVRNNHKYYSYDHYKLNLLL